MGYHRGRLQRHHHPAPGRLVTMSAFMVDRAHIDAWSSARSGPAQSRRPSLRIDLAHAAARPVGRQALDVAQPDLCKLVHKGLGCLGQAHVPSYRDRPRHRIGLAVRLHVGARPACHLVADGRHLCGQEVPEPCRSVALNEHRPHVGHRVAVGLGNVPHVLDLESAQLPRSGSTSPRCSVSSSCR
jgi:hypothetical protein